MTTDNDECTSLILKLPTNSRQWYAMLFNIRIKCEQRKSYALFKVKRKLLFLHIGIAKYTTDNLLSLTKECSKKIFYT